jgi:hypothetical protein
MTSNYDFAPCDFAAAPLCFPPWRRAPVDHALAGANADHHERHRQLRHACSFDQHRYNYGDRIQSKRSCANFGPGHLTPNLLLLANPSTH